MPQAFGASQRVSNAPAAILKEPPGWLGLKVTVPAPFTSHAGFQAEEARGSGQGSACSFTGKDKLWQPAEEWQALAKALGKKPVWLRSLGCRPALRETELSPGGPRHLWRQLPSTDENPKAGTPGLGTG